VLKVAEAGVKKIPLMELVEGWESKRFGRDKAIYVHVGSGVKFDVVIENGKFLVRSNTPGQKEVVLDTEEELKRFLFKMMCLIDNYSI